ncbi:unnamed protein product [Phaedon cochleariae]|uniref:DNA replication complex GINS protein PSF3 n=1 Tax=Phaedon cochleariae TaxID=80249 RepID=A0A9P0GNS1_PHACE|nr:unnamed protein product [Phaedon cochleariae]
MALHPSYAPNFYSIEDILATQERIPCKFLGNVPDMGHLNPSTLEKDLAAGTVLELPVWLVQELSLGRHSIVATELPKIYKESYREILKADACAVDLHKFNLYFYELGKHIKHFDRKGDVHDILLHTFKTRFRQIMDLADHSVSDPTVQERLETLEARLFSDAYDARTKLNAWLVESGAILEAANMVVNHKKRKRMNLDIIM